MPILRKLNMKQLDHRRSFANAIYLFDDYLVITFNYKEGTKTITFAEIEEVFFRIYHHSLHHKRPHEKNRYPIAPLPQNMTFLTKL